MYKPDNEEDNTHIDEAGSRVQFLATAILGNSHNQFIEYFAQWLYENDPTPALILKNVSSLIYLSVVDGLALVEGADRVEAEGVLTSELTRRLREEQREILSFAKSNPELTRAVGEATLRSVGADYLLDNDSSVFGRESWEWYEYYRKGRRHG